MNKRWIAMVGLIILFGAGFVGGMIFQRYDWSELLFPEQVPEVNPTPQTVPPFEDALKRSLNIDDEQAMTFEQLVQVRDRLHRLEDTVWLGQQFDEAVCDAHADWDVDYELDTWEDQLQPYYEQFLAEGLGGYVPPVDEIDVLFREQVEATDTYTVDYLVLSTRIEGMTVDSYLMIPKLPPPEDGYPVVVLYHASNNTIEGVAGLVEEVERTNTGGVRWVEKGAVVLVINTNSNTREIVMQTAELLDRRGFFLYLQRAHSVIDWVTTQTEIPIYRIASYGISHGGYISFWAGVTDPRIDVVAANGFARDFTQWIFTNPTTAPEPMLRGWFEYMDWCRWEVSTQARFIAPRYLLLEVGNRDKSTLIGDFNPPRTAPEPVDSRVFDIMADRIQDTYTRLGVGDHFKAVIFEGGHEMLSEDSEDWIFEQLTRP